MIRRARILVLVLLLLVASAFLVPVQYFYATDPVADLPVTRVLFVGNSFTFINDIPVMIEDLSRDAVERPMIRSVMAAYPNETLEGHIKRGIID